MNTKLLESLNFIAGIGNPAKEHTACIMSAAALCVAIENGQELQDFDPTDELDCVCPMIRKLCIRINDKIEDNEERKQWALEMIPKIIGTKKDFNITLKRAYICADFVVRKFAVEKLRKLGFEKEAQSLENLSPIIDKKTALKGKNATDAAYAVVYVAANADAAITVYAATYAVVYATAVATDAAYAADAAAYAADAAATVSKMKAMLEACLTV